MEFQPAAFDFSLCKRNLALQESGMAPMKAKSTGTTIVAATYEGGIVLGGDSRATAGNIVADKFCMKVHKLTNSIYACGAGTAADLDQVCNMLSANMRLQELNSGRKARVITALRMAKQHLFQYMGYIGAYLLVGGVDPTGTYLYDIAANGTTMAKPFAVQGSGSYSAISIMERHYKFGMTEAECKALVQQGLQAGMHGDNASGNTLNLVTIDKDGARFEGPIVPDFCKTPSIVELQYKFPTGATKVLKQKTVKYEVIESMDTN
ncbi:proteasome subunit domain-containing protein [Ditylenchus destructor]|nr:proteasome subunit domain-containing protein [Ditylenchus destructor]